MLMTVTYTRKLINKFKKIFPHQFSGVWGPQEAIKMNRSVLFVLVEIYVHASWRKL